MGCHNTPTRMVKIQNNWHQMAGEYMEQQECSLIASRNAKCTPTVEDSLAVAYNTKHTILIWSANLKP